MSARVDRRRGSALWQGICWTVGVVGAGLAWTGGPPASTAVVVHPLVEKYCAPCHGGDKPSGGVSLKAFVPGTDAKLSARVLRVLEGQQMPPTGMPQPTAAERAALVKTLKEKLAPTASPIRARRLNRLEYDRTIRDLTGLDLHCSQDFPSDDVGEGFDNLADVLSLSPLLMEKYWKAAETVARAAIVAPGSASMRIASSQFKPSAGARDIDTGRLFFTNGRSTREVDVPVGGDYRIVIRAGGMQAGPDPCRMGVFLGSTRLETFDVKAPADRPVDYEVPVKLPAGKATIGVSFDNDFYDQNIPEPRDRNLLFVQAELQGPLGRAMDLPESHRRIIFEQPDGTNQRQLARKILTRFATRAFRRPITDADADRLMKLYLAAEQQGDSFERGIQLGVTAVLSSPRFLFRTEPLPAGKSSRDLNAYELATRLSYFLWSSMPDDELMARAADGTLVQTGVLEAQLQRMLASPKIAALADGFAEQWLQLRRLAAVSPATTEFPGFSDPLRASMREETKRFFLGILAENRPVTDFIDADYSYLDGRLAAFYRIDGVSGPDFRKVPLKETRRGGLLGQAAILTLTSNPTRTSPVKRGKWILETILGAPPPPPPPGVDTVALDRKESAEGLTMRQRLEQHRKDPACASCHVRMDSLGFSLENFDGIGAWRNEDSGKPIDAAGELPDGGKINGISDLRRYLSGQRKEFTKHLLGRLTVYALGRALTPADERTISAIASKSDKAPARFQSLLHDLVTSDLFRKIKD